MLFRSGGLLQRRDLQAHPIPGSGQGPRGRPRLDRHPLGHGGAVNLIDSLDPEPAGCEDLPRLPLRTARDVRDRQPAVASGASFADEEIDPMIYGDDAPKSRVHGRKITNFWVAINTLSLGIKDAMCGFRVYPLEQLKKTAAKRLRDRKSVV